MLIYYQLVILARFELGPHCSPVKTNGYGESAQGVQVRQVGPLFPIFFGRRPKEVAVETPLFGIGRRRVDRKGAD